MNSYYQKRKVKTKKMKVIDCKNKKNETISYVKNETDKIFAETGKKLKLVVFQVEGNDASNVYIRNKKKMCEQCGIECEHVKLPNDVSADDLISKIKNANDDSSVTGIMVQLPLPDHLKKYEQEIIDTINWKKDVDGLTSESAGKLWTNQECIHPATAEGIMSVLDDDLSEKDVLVINRSKLIGKPLVKLLEERNATVTLAHSKTNRKDLILMIRRADIIITATGQPKWIAKHLFATHRITKIIDCGMCRDENGKLCGDVDTESLESLDVAVTVTPGGTGLLTTSQLMLNIVKAYKLQSKGEQL